MLEGHQVSQLKKIDLPGLAVCTNIVSGYRLGRERGALAAIAKSCKVVWYRVWGQHIYKRWLSSGDSGGLSFDCFFWFPQKIKMLRTPLIQGDAKEVDV